MRRALRILAVSIAAPIAACAIVALILYREIDSTSFLPLVFALPGSVLLLNTGYGMLGERTASMSSRYAAIIGIGMLGGGVMLGFVSMGNMQGIAMGAAYGLATALCWIGLHALTRRWGSR